MVELGDKVKDKVSGFIGIVVAKYSYMQGCSRICVQPSVDKKGKLPDTQTFDEPLLEVLETQKIKPIIDTKNQGGPDKYHDHGRSNG